MAILAVLAAPIALPLAAALGAVAIALAVAALSVALALMAVIVGVLVTGFALVALGFSALLLYPPAALVVLGARPSLLRPGPVWRHARRPLDPGHVPGPCQPVS